MHRVLQGYFMAFFSIFALIIVARITSNANSVPCGWMIFTVLAVLVDSWFCPTG